MQPNSGWIEELQPSSMLLLLLLVERNQSPSVAGDNLSAFTSLASPEVSLLVAQQQSSNQVADNLHGQLANWELKFELLSNFADICIGESE